MKKITLIVVLATMVVGVAEADFNMDWGNVEFGVYNVDGVENDGPFLSDTLVQLIWSENPISTGAAGGYLVGVNSFLPDEVILQSSYNTHVSNFGFWSPISDIYTDADVAVLPGATINAGYVYTRIFQDASATPGTYFIDAGEIDTSAYVWNHLIPATKIDAALAASVFVDQNGSTVIPEPMTLLMFGLSAMGLFVVRRVRCHYDC